MDITTITNYFSQYGLLLIFAVIFLEYLNLPGLAAGIVMPLAGVWAANSNTNFLVVILVSVLAGLMGSWILYLVGRFGGGTILEKYLPKLPRMETAVNKNIEMLRKKGVVGVFLCKLVPMARTLIAIPAGLLKMNFFKYTFSAALGIFVWNFLFIGSGYLLGDTVVQVLAKL